MSEFYLLSTEHYSFLKISENFQSKIVVLRCAARPLAVGIPPLVVSMDTAYDVIDRTSGVLVDIFPPSNRPGPKDLHLRLSVSSARHGEGFRKVMSRLAVLASPHHLGMYGHFTKSKQLMAESVN